jgi:hypothetical protein
MINPLDILKQEEPQETIWVYISYTRVDDPFEKTKSKTFINPLPIKGFVFPLSFESLRWKYYGLLKQGSIQILCDKRYEALLKQADKLKIGEDFYSVYKDADKGFSILVKRDYLVVIAEKK